MLETEYFPVQANDDLINLLIQRTDGTGIIGQDTLSFFTDLNTWFITTPEVSSMALKRRHNIGI